MRPSLQFLILTIIILASFACGPTALARDGWDNGNSGDAFVSEFILTGRDVLQRLELMYQNKNPVFDTAKLRVAITGAEVVSEEHVFLNGFERDAVNYYPEKNLIKVNRSRWRELRRSTETKARLRLVLHEYLWISGVDDTNFATSEHLIELLNITNYSPGIWWNPVNPVNYIDVKLSFAPEGCTIQPGKLDLKASEETLLLETKGTCSQDSYRKLQVIKSTGVTPASSNVRGWFHSYQLKVFDSKDALRGEMIFEPEWGACLLPETGACRASGKMTIGGVDIIFWFLRN